jgi:hypothetical protein
LDFPREAVGLSPATGAGKPLAVALLQALFALRDEAAAGTLPVDQALAV